MTERLCRRVRFTLLGGLLLVLMISCDGPRETGGQRDEVAAGVTQEAEETPIIRPLVNGSAWRISSPELDPFVDRATGRVMCGGADFGEEYGGLEVSTSYCGYITLTQPLLSAVERGELIELSVWHSALVSAEPSEGLLALQISGETVWRQELSVPAEAKSWVARFESPVSSSEGEPVLFHVSNHGANSYTLYALTVTTPSP